MYDYCVHYYKYVESDREYAMIGKTAKIAENIAISVDSMNEIIEMPFGSSFKTRPHRHSDRIQCINSYSVIQERISIAIRANMSATIAFWPEF